MRQASGLSMASLRRAYREPCLNGRHAPGVGPYPKYAPYFLAKRRTGVKTANKMIRAAALLLLVLCACDGTQSQHAFTPRAAADLAPPVTTPNASKERSHELADSLERSLDAQEDADRLAQAPAPMPDRAIGGDELGRPRHHAPAEHPSVASFQKPNDGE